MVEITEAEKQALIEEGRRQARNEITQEQEQETRDKVAELREEVGDTRVSDEIGEAVPPPWVADVSLTEPMNTQKIGPDMEAVAPMSGGNAGPPITPATVSGDGVNEWGPFDRYQIITTNWGEFAVPVGDILYFVPTVKWNAKAGEFIQVQAPHYRKPDEPRIEPQAGGQMVSVPLSAVR